MNTGISQFIAHQPQVKACFVTDEMIPHVLLQLERAF